jgi:hypothetical protein
MIEMSRVPAKAESVMECSLCESRIKSCDSCGREFANDEQIIHITHDMLNFHFCSEKCHEDFLKFDVKTEVPA